MATNNIISRTDAGALMPEEVSNTMLKNLSSTSTARELFTQVPVGRAQVRFPVLSALPVAYWVTGDTGLKQTTEVNWANKYLNIEELAVIVPIPDNVVSDSGQPIWSQVQPLCEQAAGRLIDTAVFFGTNAPASFPTNVVSAAVSAGNTATRTTNAAAAGGIVGDLSDLLGTLEADGYDANSAIGIRTLRGAFRQARNTQGERFEEIAITPDYVEIDGVRVTFPMRGLWPAAAANSAEAIAFDRSEFVLGVRQDITWKLLDQAVIQDNTGAIVYNLAQQDMVAMRMTMRVGWQVANAINYDQATEANRYPAAVLRHA
jgi:HK97 family phage major capsid protein